MSSQHGLDRGATPSPAPGRGTPDNTSVNSTTIIGRDSKTLNDSPEGSTVGRSASGDWFQRPLPTWMIAVVTLGFLGGIAGIIAGSIIGTQQASGTTAPAKIPTEKVPSTTLTADASALTFGKSVSISADGSTAVVGAPDGGNLTGQVWIYSRNSDGSWTQQGEPLVPNDCEPNYGDEIGCGFGTSVSVSYDGDTLVVGGPYDAEYFGAAWIFTRGEGGAGWVQDGGKIAGQIDNGVFGNCVALSGDGSTLLIAASGEEDGIGGAYIFSKNAENGTWDQVGDKLLGTFDADVTETRQGYSCALDAQGDTVAVGGPADDEGLGSVWIFERNAEGAYPQQGAKLQVQTPTADMGQGSSISLSRDGNTLAVGTMALPIVTVWRRMLGEWTIDTSLTYPSSSTSGVTAGSIAAVDGEGSLILVGRPGTQMDGEDGCIYRFERTWISFASYSLTSGCIKVPLAKETLTVVGYGGSMAISEDGHWAVVGAAGTMNNETGQQSGLAWVMEVDETH